MPFDAKSFCEQVFEPRTMDYPVPQLKKWFPKDEKPVWKIRSLTGAEIGQADEAAGNSELTGKLFDSLLSANAPEVAAKVKELVGQSKEKPQAVAKRIYHLQYASVDPECPLEIAVKLCDNFPILFLEISNAILVLSGQGYIPKKSGPSGKTKKSKPA